MARTEPEHDLRIIGIIGAAHGGSHYFHLVLPTLFPILKATFEVSFTELGLLVSVLFAISGLCQTPAGFLVDRIGAARVLATGLALLGAGAVVAGLAPAYWALLPAAVLMGLGNSVFHPADYAILSHHVAAKRMARAFSVHTVGGTLGWALAPVLVAGIAAAVSWRAALMFSGALGLALAVLVYTNRALLETPAHRTQTSTAAAAGLPTHLRLFTTMPILLCFTFFALQATSFIALQNFMPVTLHHLYNLDLMTATSTVTALMLGSAGGTVVGGIWADRSGRHRHIIVVGLALAAFVLALIGQAQFPLPALLAAVALAGALAGLTTPSRDMMVRASAPPGASGKVFGFVYSGLDLGATLTPLLIGSLLDAGHLHAVFVVAPLAMAASILTVTTIPDPRTGPVLADT